MTAKKKAPSAKATKPKSKPEKAATKKPLAKSAAKKSAPSKAVARKKPVASKRAKSVAKRSSGSATSAKAKVASTKKPPLKAATKKPAEKNARKKATSGKQAKPRAKAKAKSSEADSVTQKVASAILATGGDSSDDKGSDGLGFSIEDVRRILQSRKKSKKKLQAVQQEPTDSKKVVKQKPDEKKVAKVKKIQTASIDDILGFGSISVAKKPIRDESKVPKEWQAYYKILMAMRASLKGSLGERSSETLGASARESGELSLNSSDAGTETFDRDLALSMVANDQEALEEIEDAIDRIFGGTYGVCQETNKPIKKNRLQAVPFTRFSLEGQILFEKSTRRERDSGAGAFATIADSTMGQDD